MLKILSLVLIAGVALAGCQTSGFNRAMEYNWKYELVKMPDDTYRVYEHPKEDVVMTTSSVATALGAGAAKGATLGVVQPFPAEQRHEAAARKFLDDTGRANCTITRGYLLAQPQYEFFYECPA